MQFILFCVPVLSRIDGHCVARPVWGVWYVTFPGLGLLLNFSILSNNFNLFLSARAKEEKEGEEE